MDDDYGIIDDESDEDALDISMSIMDKRNNIVKDFKISDKIDFIKIGFSPHNINSIYLYCEDISHLSYTTALNTLLTMKSILTTNINMNHIKVQKINCYVTPEVIDNIITNSKRLKMYGKKLPIKVCYDEFFNKLPNIVDLYPSVSVTIIIENDLHYRQLALECVLDDCNDYINDEELPF